MRGEIYRFESPLHRGVIRDRPNRFLLNVEFPEGREHVYLSNPGRLSTVYQPGLEVLCMPANSATRQTDFTAIAIETNGIYVLVHTPLANDLFEGALNAGVLPAFPATPTMTREPALPDHGRTDFHLTTHPHGAYVEVKACTHAEQGIGKFPDSPTKRGRRHLKSLLGLTEDGTSSHVVFVAMRPDIKRIQPFRSIDPDFATLLETAADKGVGIHGFSTEFTPPTVSVHDPSIPIQFPTPD